MAGDVSETQGNVSRNRIVIQRNPTSGSGRGGIQIPILVRELKSTGYRVRLFANRNRLDEFVSRADVKQEIACLVAAGGDGTVASLANRHSEFPIAIMPLGTENLVARHLNIPRCGKTVAQIIQRNKTQQFDTGFVNEQRFLVMVSAGVDAEVVRRLNTVRSGNISHLSYASPIIRSFLSYGFPTIHVHDKNGKRLASGTHVIVTNMKEYGFHIPFCPNADPTDGRLDVRVFNGRSRVATFLHAIRTKLRFADNPRDVVRFDATELELRTDKPGVPVQYDGDPAANCPVRIRIAPKSMTLLVRDQPR